MPACARKLTTREASSLSGWTYDVLKKAIARGLFRKPAAGRKPSGTYLWSAQEVCALRTCRALWERTRDMQASAYAMLLIADADEDKIEADFSAGKRYLAALNDQVVPRLMSRGELDAAIESARLATAATLTEIEVVAIDVERAMEATQAAIADMQAETNNHKK
jgi:hypothetical protein